MFTLFKKFDLFKYIKNVGISIDQFFSTLTGGDADETISSRLGKAKENGSKFAIGVCWVINKILFWSDTPHCVDSIEKDEGKDSVI